MNDLKTSRALPEKVLRRHAEMLTELLPDISKLVIEEGRPADVLLSRHLRERKELGARDRRFLSQAVFSFFRWHGWTVGQLKLPLPEACLIGAALDSDEIDSSFRYLEGKCSLPVPIEPLGNKTLEEKRDILNGWFGASLQLADLVLADFESLVSPEVAERCITEFQSRPPTWLRSRIAPAALQAALRQNEVEFTMHPKLASALAVSGGTNLNTILAPFSAQYVIQDIASQCVAEICAPQKGGDWWDCCTGAGGKALHLMDLMDQEGKVLATDIRIPVLKELKKRTRKLGLRGIRTQTFNAVHDEPFPKTFDGVLVDAPCSGWGTWARNPDARLRTDRRDVAQCANRQLKILKNASWCVKPGGTLVYAVCTITRPETEEVVSKFLEEKTEFKLAPFAHPLAGEQTDGTVQIWPWEGDGMFIARFIRNPE